MSSTGPPMNSISLSARRALSRCDSEAPTTRTAGCSAGSGWARRRASSRRGIETRACSARRTSASESSARAPWPGVESTTVPPELRIWAKAPPLSGSGGCWSSRSPAPPRTSVARSDARVLRARSMPASRLAEKRSWSRRASPPKSTIMTAAKARVSRTRIGTRRSRSPIMVVGPEPVAGAADGLDEIAVELVAQVAHVDLDHVRAVLVGVVPHVLEQLEAGEDLARVAHEGLEQGELAPGQGQLGLAAPHPVAGRVQAQVADLEDGGPGRRGPAHERPDAGQQLVERERLDQVVVGPAVQAADPVLDAVAGGEHQRGRPHPLLAQLPADVEADDPRQHEVEEDDVV